MESVVVLFLLFLLGLLIGAITLIATVIRNNNRIKILSERVDRLCEDLDRFSARQEFRYTPTTPPAKVVPPPGITPEPISVAFSPAPASDAAPFSPPQSRPPLIKPVAEAAFKTQAGLPAAKTPEFGASQAPPPPVSKDTTTGSPAVQPSQPLFPLPAAKPAWSINWEQFIGGKLINWIAGFALFLGVVFLVKLSIDRNLITPEMRIAAGYLTGIGLLVAGILIKRREYVVLAQTFCATGVVCLYAVSFAAHALYKFTDSSMTFGLMVLVTATAFLLAVRLNAMVVAILGMLGGFLTPPLLSTGVDRPLGLFGYIAILVIGLQAVAFKQRWGFLTLMGAIGTVLMQVGWVEKFFAVERVYAAMAIFLGFDLLYLAAFWCGNQLRRANRWLDVSVLMLPAVSLMATFMFLSFSTLGSRPGLIYGYILAADLCVLAVVWLRHPWAQAQTLAGSVVFLSLAIWSAGYLTSDNLNWFLGGVLGFAILHAAYPVVLARRRPEIQVLTWSQLFPLVALFLVFIPLFKLPLVSFMIWPCVLLLDVVAIAVSAILLSAVAIGGALVLTVAVTGLWLLHAQADQFSLNELVIVIGGFAVFFFAVTLWLGWKLAGGEKGAKAEADAGHAGILSERLSMDQMRQFAALSGVLPFLLLILAVAKLRLADPSPAFGLALLLLGLLLGLALICQLELLIPVSLASVLALEYTWHLQLFNGDAPLTPLLWYGLFWALFLVLPFIFQKRLRDSDIPWAVAALSGPLHFFLIFRAIKLGYPNPYLGLVPAIMAVPLLAGLAYLVRAIPAERKSRLGILAAFGGCALFFITLIFPIQFDRQWITIGWALEGVALLWLFHRVPHPGLPWVGVALLVVAFGRLALNQQVFDYYQRSGTPILNWYLYTYGLVTVCLLAGARLLAPPRHRLDKLNVPPLLYSLGTILAFFLLNIEIADYFSTGQTLTFQFYGNFGRDMTYSISWALFALVLLIIGIRHRQKAPRYASLTLIGVTLVKLFFHDLSQLNQLYRIGALIGVAIVLFFASILYQRFLAQPDDTKTSNEKT